MNKGISIEVVLEAFSAYLAENGRKQSRIERYNYDITGFYKGLRANEKLLDIKSGSELPKENY